MEITFEKVNEHRYEAYFEASGDFNLHVERVKNGTLEVYQRGVAEGEYDFAWSAGIGARKVIDYDFAAFVYPKWIKVVSSSEVISASVNFNEGGGSGSGTDSSNVVNIEYYKINRDSDSFDEGALYDAITTCCAYKKNNEIFNGSPRKNNVENNFKDIGYCAGIAMPDRLYKYSKNEYQLVGGYNSWLENLYAVASFYDETADYSFLEPITKEEFYNLDNTNTPES